jgi:ribonucleoside-diphosphate reductase alpha subunit
MKRVESDGPWSLFSPDSTPGLIDAYDSPDHKAFTELYEKYESEGKALKTIKARELWEKILDSQVETGTPYMLYKDSCNYKSNQKNLGTIKSSNLCTEILEFTDKDETAVCNLASIALPKYVIIPSGKVREKDKKLRKFDFQKLYEVTYQATVNLNQVIDVNYYPTPETAKSNFRHRPIGLGVQGLADTFVMMGMPFESDEARKLNKDIFETIYFAALSASKDLATKFGPYETFAGSPASQGMLQYDLWGISETELSGLWDFMALKEEIKKHGLRNSLLVAPMPTASTAQILGNNECFEPFTANLYKRNTLSGEYAIMNKHLVEDLVNNGLWTDSIRMKLFLNNGSVQDIDEIPSDIKELYKTVWEMKGKSILEMARDRNYFIDQSQSLNMFMAEPTMSKLSSAHFYGWKLGLKTGMYYLRTKPKAQAIKGLGIDTSNMQSLDKVEKIEKPELMKDFDPNEFAAKVCSLDNPDCESCSG